MKTNAINKQFTAVRAVIVKDGKVLIIKEASRYEGGTNHNKYDLPGGKVNLGEDIYTALLRETKEEVGLDIKILDPFFVDEWRPIIKGEQIQIIGIFFECHLVGNGQITLGEDHDDYKWVDKDNYKDLPLIDATRKALDKYFY